VATHRFTKEIEDAHESGTNDSGGSRGGAAVQGN
jgi:hypothetical protein